MIDTPQIKKFIKEHGEAFLIVLLIVILVAVLLTSKFSSGSAKASYSSLSEREKLRYDLTSAVRTISGDNEAKILVVWDENKPSQSTSPDIITMFNNTNAQNMTSNSLKVSGVAVVSKNASKADVKVKITYLLSNLLEISADKISVIGV